MPDIQCKSSSIVGGAIAWDAIKDVVTGHAAYQTRHRGVRFELVCITNQRFNEGAIAQAALNGVTLIDAANIKLMLEGSPITLDDLVMSLQTSWSDPALA